MQLNDFVAFITERHQNIHFIAIHTKRNGIKELRIALVGSIEENMDRDVWGAEDGIGVEVTEPYLLPHGFSEELVVKQGRSATEACGGTDFKLLFFRSF